MIVVVYCTLKTIIGLHLHYYNLNVGTDGLMSTQ